MIRHLGAASGNARKAAPQSNFRDRDWLKARPFRAFQKRRISAGRAFLAALRRTHWLSWPLQGNGSPDKPFTRRSAECPLFSPTLSVESDPLRTLRTRPARQRLAGSGLAVFGLAERRFRHRDRCCQSQASARARREALSRTLRASLAAASNSERASASRPSRNRKQPLAAGNGAGRTLRHHRA